VIRPLVRVLVLLVVAGATATVVNAVRPKPLRWIVTKEDVYPSPKPIHIKNEISLEEMLAVIDRGAVVIDARAEEKYRNGHIPGAHNLPAHSVHEDLGKVYDWATPEMLVVVYCAGGIDECEESREVFDVLEANKFTNLKLYLGGWKEWTQKNMPIAEDSGDPQ
jgi:3-mercaptopyruvate sulfurtransferase SseA